MCDGNVQINVYGVTTTIRNKSNIIINGYNTQTINNSTRLIKYIVATQ